MKKFLGCCALLSLVSCLDEQRVDPATPSTFVRYINSGLHDTSKAMEKTGDGGYIILANTSELTLASPIVQNTIRIKMVKVNAYGSVEWSRVLPDSPVDSLNYVGNGISIGPDGYIVSGEVIQKRGAIAGETDLLILQTDETGVQTSSLSIDFSKASGAGVSVHGQAATVPDPADPNRLLVLGSITGHEHDMILAEVIINSGAPPTVNWNWTFGSDASTTLNSMFLDANQDIIFGGTVTRNNTFTDLRLVRAIPDAQGTASDLNFGDPDLSEQANGICRTANGFAMTGSSNVTGKQDRDILFARFSNGGAQLFSRTYPVYYPGVEENDNNDVKLDEEGNGVCTTSDNGFIILATIRSSTSGSGETIGRGDKDYYLMKVNAFGDVQWKHAFGSKRDDTGVCVAQADDGGFMILGTTILANLATIALIKTNSSGEIE